MKKNKMTCFTVATTLMLGIMLALAHYSDAGPAGPLMGMGPLMHCIQQLDLSSETLATVEALITTRNENKAGDRDTMKAAMDTYFAALTAVPRDSAALVQAHQAIIALEQKHTESRFALDSSIVDLLNDDETAKLSECLGSLPEPPDGPPGFGSTLRSK